MLKRVLIWPVVLVSVHLGAAPAPAPAPASGHAHARERVGVHSLDVQADAGRLHVLLADYPPAGPPVLVHRVSIDAGRTWSVPVRVDAGAVPPSSPHRGMDAQIAASGDRLVAVWMTPGTGLFGSGPLATAWSVDGGRTWRPGPNPADDRLTTGHSFTDLTADEAGRFHLVWLDSRDGRQGLRYARSLDGGRTWQKNRTLKQDTCECCWNRVVMAGPDPVVLFRDKQPRDMALVVAKRQGERWEKPRTVGDFDWDFNGCPHVGGGLAVGTVAGAPGLHAVVWTGKPGVGGVYHLRSVDLGRKWTAPQRLGTPTARRSDVASRGEEVGAVWEETADGETALFYAHSRTGGREWSVPERLTEADASAAYPRIVALADGFVVLWTQVAAGQSGTWHTLTRPFSGATAKTGPAE